MTDQHKIPPTAARSNPEQKLVQYEGRHIFPLGSFKSPPPPPPKEPFTWERFDPDKVDWSRLEDILSPLGNELLLMRQEHFDAEEYSNQPIDDFWKAKWKQDEAALAGLVDQEEVELIKMRVSKPTSSGSRMSFKRGSFGKTSNPDVELFGEGIKAVVLKD